MAGPKKMFLQDQRGTILIPYAGDEEFSCLYQLDDDLFILPTNTPPRREKQAIMMFDAKNGKYRVIIADTRYPIEVLKGVPPYKAAVTHSTKKGISVYNLFFANNDPELLKNDNTEYDDLYVSGNQIIAITEPVQSSIDVFDHKQRTFLYRHTHYSMFLNASISPDNKLFFVSKSYRSSEISLNSLDLATQESSKLCEAPAIALKGFLSDGSLITVEQTFQQPDTRCVIHYIDPSNGRERHRSTMLTDAHVYRIAQHNDPDTFIMSCNNGIFKWKSKQQDEEKHEEA